MRSSESAQRLGSDAERRVRRHYRLRGYVVLDANAWAGRNEVDLVVRRGRKLLFVEVKAKSGDRYGSPLDAVTEEKVRRVRRAAEGWLAARPELAALDIGFEAAAVEGGRVERVAF
jgi:Holliday junction resolvase-like predicted endonuclease